MLYLDTSIIVAFLTPEPASEKTKSWIAAQDETRFAISDWVATEFLSALGTKIRVKALSEPDAKIAEEIFLRWRDQLTLIKFENRYFADADRHLARRTTALRASDALHLAIAASMTATLCTRDRRFADAVVKLNYPLTFI